MLQIGTSGWHYAHFRGLFYPEKLPSERMLEFYSRQFTTTEINYTFYKLPETEKFTQWYRTTPKGFLFAVKASRFLTHMKKLSDPGHAVERLLSRVSALKEKLGPILFQLPPRWHLNFERLLAFLELLPKNKRFVFEFRDPSWMNPEVMALLQQYQVGFCVHDSNHILTPLIATANFVYVRLHGSPTIAYSHRELNAWETRVRDWLSQKIDVFFYFNNDTQGNAIRDALYLKSRLEGIDRRAS